MRRPQMVDSAMLGSSFGGSMVVGLVLGNQSAEYDFARRTEPTDMKHHLP
jgi:hypothetical protein